MQTIRIQEPDAGERTALIEQINELDKCVKVFKCASCALLSLSIVMLLSGTIILGSSKRNISKKNTGTFLICMAIAGVLGSVIVCIGTKCNYRNERRRLIAEGI